MAIIDDVKAAYRSVMRQPLGHELAVAQAALITSGASTLNLYIEELIVQAGHSTVPALAIYSLLFGNAPLDPSKLDSLAAFGASQHDSYFALKVANPDLGPFEAFGASYAIDSSTRSMFAAKFASVQTGTSSDADFINSVYKLIYGMAPSAAAFDNLQSQIAYFTNLYQSSSLAAAQGDPNLHARGAVLGQIVGYAFSDPAAGAISSIDDQIIANLTKLAPVAQSGGGGGGGGGGGAPGPTTFTLTTAADGFAGGAIDNTFTALDDSGNPTWTTNDKLDGGGGNDIFNVTQAASIAGAPAGATVANIETANIASSGSVAIDTASWTGLTALAISASGAVTASSVGTNTVSVTETGAGQLASNIVVDGGSNVTVQSTHQGAGGITVGGTTAPTGAVSISSSVDAGQSGGQITVNGGSTISVTQAATNAAGTTVNSESAVAINGGLNTTSVAVTQAAVAAAAVAVAGTVGIFVFEAG